MEPGSSNPYSTPQTLPDPPADSGYLSPLPPYTPVRLAIAFGLICVGWFMVWANAHDHFKYGFILIPSVFFPLYARVTNSHSQRTTQDIRGYQAVLMIVAFIVFMLLMILGFDNKLPPAIKEALLHPGWFVLGWLMHCRILFNDWRKRRNNPPYQPKPHAELPSKSVWKPLSRQ